MANSNYLKSTSFMWNTIKSLLSLSNLIIVSLLQYYAKNGFLIFTAILLIVTSIMLILVYYTEWDISVSKIRMNRIDVAINSVNAVLLTISIALLLNYSGTHDHVKNHLYRMGIIWKSPDITQTNGISDTGKQEFKPTTPAFSVFYNKQRETLLIVQRTIVFPDNLEYMGLIYGFLDENGVTCPITIITGVSSKKLENFVPNHGDYFYINATEFDNIDARFIKHGFKKFPPQEYGMEQTMAIFDTCDISELTCIYM
ncbi:hypothetical protein A3Q56_06486 [Intoshia linei]|uniref:Uncharacterized protein n=1 Tax=Intoshia linei TaxID=1819745 RepID=A0A177AVP2_9BILA|nr:hypothetical protein A3Q56_06486 [Intoshia linei]